MPKQLPLQFEFLSNQRFNTFYPGNNEEIINHLQQAISSNEQQIFLWGAAGTGKTHLLQAIIQEANKKKRSTFFFSLQNPKLPSPLILDGLENIEIVCLDNIDQIAGNPDWESAFFTFFNSHREANRKLVLSASCPPKFLDIQLPDLKTRMNWGLTLKLQPLNDEQQLNALIYKANDLGFEIPLPVGKFLINHYSRDLPSIWRLLDQIEHATLSAKRKITIPFLKQIVADQDKHESR